MKPKERQNNILSLLRTTHREWNVKELELELKVSALTIRRDLIELVNTGNIIRTHGGCIISDDGVNTFFHEQLELNVELKSKIGKEAAKLITDESTILLGDGTTTFQFATFFNSTKPITIYTNSIHAIQELKKHPNCRIYVLGGQYDSGYDMLLLKGSLSDRVLEMYNFDLVILGADAISSNGACMLKTEEAARTYQIILQRGKQKILLADHTKLNARGSVSFGKLSDFDLWITTKGITKKQMTIFKKQVKIKEIKPI